MNFVKRAVLDTSTLVSAALRPGSNPSRVFLVALDRYEVCVSRETLQELSEVLLRPNFDRYLERRERQAFVEIYRSHSTLFEIVERVSECSDPRDNKFLELAVSCSASVIISSDNDLLVMHPFRGISIVGPARFLMEEDA